MKNKITMCLAFFWISSCTTASDITSQPEENNNLESSLFKAENIKQMMIKNKNRNIKIIGSESNIAIVKVEKIKFPSDVCSLKIEEKYGVLVVDVGIKLTKKGHCEANFEIHLPKKIDVVVTTESGNVKSSGTEGKIDVKIDSGNAMISGIFILKHTS